MDSATAADYFSGRFGVDLIDSYKSLNDNLALKDVDSSEQGATMTPLTTEFYAMTLAATKRTTSVVHYTWAGKRIFHGSRGVRWINAFA